ncbi:MAG: Phosphatidylglycerophosphatase A (EC [uncultured Campylobacterales bacterium]|uniref:Phosphatidylglycerophosphatase A (EC) n=1 Tax=uncultured Campylobacterales bacterium TaxID=352960 RepID=A0A6S6SIT0_9BACT|nr:MAG: Phosphatidylglycerophosphatase A (EC [uncultured Campylobacterales bacterium]
MNKLFVTFGYTGMFPKAPGTVGSIAGALVALPIVYFLGEQGQSTLFLLAILLTIIAIKPIDTYAKSVNRHDPKEVVIDEVAGIFIALSLSCNTISQFVLSFVFFRILDIAKPSIIGYCDRNVKGGLGVMLDDIFAGVFAGLLSLAVYFIASSFGVSLP